MSARDPQIVGPSGLCVRGVGSHQLFEQYDPSEPLRVSALASGLHGGSHPLVGDELRPGATGTAPVVESDDLDRRAPLRAVLRLRHLRLRQGPRLDPESESDLVGSHVRQRDDHPVRRAGGTPRHAFARNRIVRQRALALDAAGRGGPDVEGSTLPQ